MHIKILVGNGKKIGLLTLPFLVLGVAANVVFPSFFGVGGPPLALALVSIVVLIPGLVVWAWSVYLILTRIPKKELITTGPYSLIRHPLYCGVAILVFPWVGFLLNTWLGLVIGLVVYIGSRLYGPEEERMLEKIFGEKWVEYSVKVKIPWL